jgi:ABC-2 type transport system ATP-binding protein
VGDRQALLDEVPGGWERRWSSSPRPARRHTEEVGDVLQARGIVKRFGERLVLDGVDLEVPAGQVVGLLGPNGAGKTTLMRVLFGVLEADAGTIEWRGAHAVEEDRRSWGYMPQERGLYRDMRVIDQVSWIGRLHGVDRRTATARAQRLLDQLGLGDRAGDKIMDLSGGMAQRVQLAAAMVHEPELLVLDEPFSGLDPVAVQFLSEVITEHVEAGRNLLFSSHQLDLVEDLCDTITLVDRGRVVLQGDLRALKAASPDRLLRVDVPVDPSWLDRTATVERIDASGTRIRLHHGADPGAVLDLVRANVAVRDFGVESPSLSELFLQAAGHSALESPPGPELDGDARGGDGTSLLGRLTGGRTR